MFAIAPVINLRSGPWADRKISGTNRRVSGDYGGGGVSNRACESNRKLREANEDTGAVMARLPGVNIMLGWNAGWQGKAIEAEHDAERRRIWLQTGLSH